MTRCAVVILMLAASACAPRPSAPVDPCAGWAPIRPTLDDVEKISDGLAAQILGHNEHGAALGCWRP